MHSPELTEQEQHRAHGVRYGWGRPGSTMGWRGVITAVEVEQVGYNTWDPENRVVQKHLFPRIVG